MNSEAKNAIDLWVLDSSSLQLGDLTRDYADLLSAVETERLAGYSLARSKGQFLLSRALLRQVLGHLWPRRVDQVEALRVRRIVHLVAHGTRRHVASVGAV